MVPATKTAMFTDESAYNVLADGAIFRAWCWGGYHGDRWVDVQVTHVPEGAADGRVPGTYFTMTYDDDVTNFKLVRFNPAILDTDLLSSGVWDASFDGYVWGQTGNMLGGEEGIISVTVFND